MDGEDAEKICVILSHMAAFVHPLLLSPDDAGPNLRCKDGQQWHSVMEDRMAGQLQSGLM